MSLESRTCTVVLAALAGWACQRSGPADEPGAALPHEPATLAGQIELAGELASARRGTLTLCAWGVGETGRKGAQPYLSRTYVIDDPDWTRGEGVLTRYFGLCDADRVGDPARGLPCELEIEASFDPDGLQITREGVVRGSAPARNGAKDVSIRVERTTETAQPQGSPKKGG